MSFLNMCQKCTHSDCCSEPFFAFVTKTEKDKITQYIRSHKIKLKIDEIFRLFSVQGLENETFHVIIKKKMTESVFS